MGRVRRALHEVQRARAAKADAAASEAFLAGRWIGGTSTGNLQPKDRLFPPLIGSAASLSHSAIKTRLRAACADLGLPEGITLQDLRAAGEQHVATLTSRPEAAEWARHGLGVQMAHYVAVETERAAGWQ